VFVCQLTDEVACEEPEDCPEGQVCAADGECRDDCGDANDCAREQQCLDEGNVCADEEELDEAGNLTGTPDDDVGDDDTDDDDFADDDGDDDLEDDDGDDDGSVSEADGGSGDGDAPSSDPDAGAAPPGEGSILVLTEAAETFAVEGMELDVPAGAVGGEVELTVTIESEPPVPLPEEWDVLGDIYAIAPHGFEFDEPVTLRIPYDRSGETPPALVALPGVDEGEQWSVLSAEFQGDGYATVLRSKLSYYVVVSGACGADGAACQLQCDGCDVVCGDGVWLAQEACDDGNTADGDGCNANCTAVEDGFDCPGGGAACVGACGDSLQLGGEACDDGNTADGDGCAGDCSAVEEGFACPVPGDDCIVDLPNPSCEGLETTCNDESCCTTLWLPGGEFLMGAPEDDPDATAAEKPEHSVRLSEYFLDKYEVTVGRFRKFVEAYDGTPPADGTGQHPRIQGTGWQSHWPLPVDQEEILAMVADRTSTTWTTDPGAFEARPINYLTWYVAYLFCAWDGGRLPTEAEWEFAASAGDENRAYPWGNEEPDDTRGAFDLDWPVVGSVVAGEGRWGHLDLAGSVSEWTLDAYEGDWYGIVLDSCVDCANTVSGAWTASGSDGENQVVRGTVNNATPRRPLPAWKRSGASASTNVSGSFRGVRCARDVP
jgi:cysteine-rich repeat protein